MRTVFTLLTAAAVASALAADFTLEERAVPTINVGKCCQDAQDATTFALIYGAPLAAFIKLATPYIQAGEAGINYPVPQFSLAGPSTKEVVRPNQDTLYTPAIIDLSTDNVVVTVPKIPDSIFWDFAFYDPYGDNFANIGSVHKNKSGEYLLQYASKAPSTYSSQDSQEGAKSNYAGVVYSPTYYGILLVRILVTPGDKADIKTVNGYQKEIKLTAVKRTPAQTKVPSLLSLSKKVVKNGGLSLKDPQGILSYLSAVATYNESPVHSDRTRVAGILKQAGLSKGKYTKPKNVDLGKAVKSANATATASPRKPGGIEILNNDWALIFPKTAGDWGTQYAQRAAIASLGYLQLTPDQQQYPFYLPDTIASPALPKDKAYLFTFSGKPPIPVDGYWSLTVYNAQLFLVPNKLKHYALGDRSNLTYPNGELVYGPKSKNGKFQILIQAVDNPPPKNWTSNWLPGPRGGGFVPFNLRFGAPGPALSNGSYVYPKVTTIKAIT